MNRIFTSRALIPTRNDAFTIAIVIHSARGHGTDGSVTNDTIRTCAITGITGGYTATPDTGRLTFFHTIDIARTLAMARIAEVAPGSA